MRRTIATAVVAALCLLGLSGASGAAASWGTIARSQSSGGNATEGSVLSSRPSALRIKLVTGNSTSGYMFWTETCSVLGTPSVHYGKYFVTGNATNYRSLPVPTRATWCSVAWMMGETAGTLKMYLQRGTAAPPTPGGTATASCSDQMPYVQLVKDPDALRGKCITEKGQVFQYDTNTGLTSMLVSIVDLGYNTWTDNVLIRLPNAAMGNGIYENDIIQVWGPIGGSYTYTTTLGRTATVPVINAKHLKLISK